MTKLPQATEVYKLVDEQLGDDASVEETLRAVLGAMGRLAVDNGAPIRQVDFPAVLTGRTRVTVTTPTVDGGIVRPIGRAGRKLFLFQQTLDEASAPLLWAHGAEGTDSVQIACSPPLPAGAVLCTAAADDAPRFVVVTAEASRLYAVDPVERRAVAVWDSVVQPGSETVAIAAHGTVVAWVSADAQQLYIARETDGGWRNEHVKWHGTPEHEIEYWHALSFQAGSDLLAAVDHTGHCMLMDTVARRVQYTINMRPSEHALALAITRDCAPYAVDEPARIVVRTTVPQCVGVASLHNFSTNGVDLRGGGQFVPDHAHVLAGLVDPEWSIVLRVGGELRATSAAGAKMLDVPALGVRTQTAPGRADTPECACEGCKYRAGYPPCTTGPGVWVDADGRTLWCLNQWAALVCVRVQ